MKSFLAGISSARKSNSQPPTPRLDSNANQPEAPEEDPSSISLLEDARSTTRSSGDTVGMLNDSALSSGSAGSALAPGRRKPSMNPDEFEIAANNASRRNSAAERRQSATTSTPAAAGGTRPQSEGGEFDDFPMVSTGRKRSVARSSPEGETKAQLNQLLPDVDDEQVLQPTTGAGRRPSTENSRTASAAPADRRDSNAGPNITFIGLHDLQEVFSSSLVTSTALENRMKRNARYDEDYADIQTLQRNFGRFRGMDVLPAHISSFRNKVASYGVITWSDLLQFSLPFLSPSDKHVVQNQRVHYDTRLPDTNDPTRRHGSHSAFDDDDDDDDGGGEKKLHRDDSFENIPTLDDSVHYDMHVDAEPDASFAVGPMSAAKNRPRGREPEDKQRREFKSHGHQQDESVLSIPELRGSDNEADDQEEESRPQLRRRRHQDAAAEEKRPSLTSATNSNNNNNTNNNSNNTRGGVTSTPSTQPKPTRTGSAKWLADTDSENSDDDAGRRHAPSTAAAANASMNAGGRPVVHQDDAKNYPSSAVKDTRAQTGGGRPAPSRALNDDDDDDEFGSAVASKRPNEPIVKNNNNAYNNDHDDRDDDVRESTASLPPASNIRWKRRDWDSEDPAAVSTAPATTSSVISSLDSSAEFAVQPTVRRDSKTGATTATAAATDAKRPSRAMFALTSLDQSTMSESAEPSPLVPVPRPSTGDSASTTGANASAAGGDKRVARNRYADIEGDSPSLPGDAADEPAAAVADTRTRMPASSSATPAPALASASSVPVQRPFMGNQPPSQQHPHPLVTHASSMSTNQATDAGSASMDANDLMLRSISLHSPSQSSRNLHEDSGEEDKNNKKKNKSVAGRMMRMFKGATGSSGGNSNSNNVKKDAEFGSQDEHDGETMDPRSSVATSVESDREQHQQQQKKTGRGIFSAVKGALNMRPRSASPANPNNNNNNRMNTSLESSDTSDAEEKDPAGDSRGRTRGIDIPATSTTASTAGTGTGAGIASIGMRRPSRLAHAVDSLDHHNTPGTLGVPATNTNTTANANTAAAGGAGAEPGVRPETLQRHNSWGSSSPHSIAEHQQQPQKRSVGMKALGGLAKSMGVWTTARSRDSSPTTSSAPPASKPSSGAGVTQSHDSSLGLGIAGAERAAASATAISGAGAASSGAAAEEKRERDQLPTLQRSDSIDTSQQELTFSAPIPPASSTTTTTANTSTANAAAAGKRDKTHQPPLGRPPSLRTHGLSDSTSGTGAMKSPAHFSSSPVTRTSQSHLRHSHSHGHGHGGQRAVVSGLGFGGQLRMSMQSQAHMQPANHNHTVRSIAAPQSSSISSSAATVAVRAPSVIKYADTQQQQLSSSTSASAASPSLETLRHRSQQVRQTTSSLLQKQAKSHVNSNNSRTPQSSRLMQTMEEIAYEHEHSNNHDDDEDDDHHSDDHDNNDDNNGRNRKSSSSNRHSHTNSQSQSQSHPPENVELLVNLWQTLLERQDPQAVFLNTEDLARLHALVHRVKTESAAPPRFDAEEVRRQASGVRQEMKRFLQDHPRTASMKELLSVPVPRYGERVVAQLTGTTTINNNNNNNNNNSNNIGLNISTMRNSISINSNNNSNNSSDWMHMLGVRHSGTLSVKHRLRRGRSSSAFQRRYLTIMLVPEYNPNMAVITGMEQLSEYERLQRHVPQLGWQYELVEYTRSVTSLWGEVGVGYKARYPLKQLRVLKTDPRANRHGREFSLHFAWTAEDVVVRHLHKDNSKDNNNNNINSNNSNNSNDNNSNNNSSNSPAPAAGKPAETTSQTQTQSQTQSLGESKKSKKQQSTELDSNSNNKSVKDDQTKSSSKKNDNKSEASSGVVEVKADNDNAEGKEEDDDEDEEGKDETEKRNEARRRLFPEEHEDEEEDDNNNEEEEKDDNEEEEDEEGEGGGDDAHEEDDRESVFTVEYPRSGVQDLVVKFRAKDSEERLNWLNALQQCLRDVDHWQESRQLLEHQQLLHHQVGTANVQQQRASKRVTSNTVVY